MFEDVNFDFNEDILLETSFTPASSSTQTSFSQKRLSQENTDKENYKKLRLYNEEQQSITYKDKEIKHSPKKIEKNIETSVSVPSKVVKRKFPGPAGLLPERREHNKSILDFISDDKARKVNRTQDEMFLCSQRTVSVFEDGPWKEMTKDFYVPNEEAPYEKFTIKWIKKQASLKKLLVNHKAPFLAGIIESLEIFDGKIPTVNVTLKDATGEIQGTVLHSLYEDYCNFFTIGSVLVLKQFGVFSGGYKNHCLTITPNNLVTIYCLESQKTPPNCDINQLLMNNCDLVKKIVIQKCTVNEIMKKYEEDILLNEQKNRTINFGKLHQNHDNVIKNVGNTMNDDIQRIPRNNFKLPNARMCTNILRTGVNSNTTVGTLHKDILSDASAKRKFNFKRPDLQTSPDTSKAAQKSGGEDKSVHQVSDQMNYDIILTSSQNSSSQISVRSDTKEHSEIWKKLLEDVDTDALFDEF